MTTLRGVVLVALVLVAIVIVSCAKQESAGQVTVVIQTDFAMPKDLDYVRLEVRTDGMPLGTESPLPLYRNDYPVDLAAPADVRVTIPATFAVYNTKGIAEPIAVRVSAGRQNQVRVVRDALTTVPTDRNAMLRMYLQWLSDGSAVAPPAGAVDPRATTSACPPSQTNIAGTCTDAHVDAATLPDFDATKIYGGPTPATGTGFDVLSCYAGAVPVTPDAACSFALSAGAAADQVNVGIELPPGSDGECDAGHCIVALDRQDVPVAPIVGWSLTGGRVQLPKGVCTRAAAVPAMRVVVSSACPSKTQGSPACGPASASTDCSIHGAQGGDASTMPPPAVTAQTLSLGRHHTCLVSTGGLIQCWGDNTFFQTATDMGSFVPQTSPADTSLPGQVGVTALSSGLDSTCVIAGSVLCWGNNSYGELGTDPTPPGDAPNATPTLVPTMGEPPIPEVIAVSRSTASKVASPAPQSHACASGGGITHCWGSNATMQLGDNGPGGAAVSTLTLDATALALGDGFSCAVDTGHVVRCWGKNDVGQVGLPQGQPVAFAPALVNSAPRALDVVAGIDFGCALAMDNSVSCWGNGTSGVPTKTKSAAVTQAMTVETGALQIAAGDDFVCAILNMTPKRVRCWGSNTVGQLGTTYQTNVVDEPVLPAGFDTGLDTIVAGGQRACVVAGHHVACWGLNDHGQIDGTPSAMPTLPHEVPYGF